ncbi:MAG TPA: NAD(P)H-dependent oxidoreductase [Candidatus Nanoarchaeia archaeon]|nr:NAD(P)H-dependent oxidoreductase [Candidatus Nanoarchaeia archaeon]
MSSLNKDLEWRYATKKFNPDKKVSEEDFSDLLESLRLSASSYGLQPWKFIAIEDSELRKTLRKHAWDQPQVTDASSFIVLCAKDDVTPEYIKEYIRDIAKTRDIKEEALKGYEDMMLGSFSKKDPHARIEWAKKQVYIALGTLLAACAHKRIDACPMEGFDHEKFNEILDLKKQGLTATVCCAIGYRADDDANAKMKKVRFSMDKIVEKR